MQDCHPFLHWFIINGVIFISIVFILIILVLLIVLKKGKKNELK
jgi:hypothetical protein